MAYANKREDHTYSYDPNVDYSKKMEEAVSSGDYTAAAQYERQRNQKIAGEGLTQYQQTNKYTQYLPYGQQMDDIFAKIMNREKFSYDLDADALYQQYKDKFMQQGKLAMQDTMGQAAALTGGYGNSYAQSVGQQAYNQQLGQLNDIVPELYSLARERYDAEGNAMLNQYSVLADRENAEYNRNAAEKEKAYNLALSMLQSGIMPSQAVLEASGLSSEDAQKIYDAANTSSYRYAGSTGGSSSGNKSGNSSESSSETGSENDSAYQSITSAAELSENARALAERFSRSSSPEHNNSNFETIMSAWENGDITLAEAVFLLKSIGFDDSPESVKEYIDVWGG